MQVYRVSPKKSRTLCFHYFDIRKYSIFWFHQIKHCLLKRMIPRSFDFVWQYWFYNHFLKHSHLQILLNLRELFRASIAVHKFSLCFVCTDQWASGQQCMEVRKAIIPDWNVTRMKRKLKITMFWEMTIESKPISMILVSFFSEHNVFSDKKRRSYIFEYQSNKNWAFRFLEGHPV